MQLYSRCNLKNCVNICECGILPCTSEEEKMHFSCRFILEATLSDMSNMHFVAIKIWMQHVNLCQNGVCVSVFNTKMSHCIRSICCENKGEIGVKWSFDWIVFRLKYQKYVFALLLLVRLLLLLLLCTLNFHSII